ncbi:MAG: ABC transporter substrate-binding protein, partial [Pseudomonadota bacterium]
MKLLTFRFEGRTRPGVLDGEHIIDLAAAGLPVGEHGDLAADGKSVTWKLKPGVKWSDGEPFTAEDVKFTFDYLSNKD